MSKASDLAKRRTPPRPTMRAAPDAPWFKPEWLDRVAFALLLAVVIARVMMLEAVRDALIVTPGAPRAPAAPGPAAGLVLDLIACIPALLALVRRGLAGGPRLRLSWSMVPLGLLGLWAAASTFWAADKFAALVSSAHLLAAFIALWAAAQVVRTWRHLRILAGVCYGVLLVLVVQGVYFLYFERPSLRAAWAESGQDILRQRGLEPGSFEANQFANKVLHGELMGFSASPNTYAAVLVLTMVVACGVVIDRAARRRGRDDGPRPVPASGLDYQSKNSFRRDEGGGTGPALAAVGIALAAVVAPAFGMIYQAQSRTALATPFLGAAALGGIAVAGPWLARRRGAVYAAAVAGFALVTAFVVHHGIGHGTLFHDSLNFRWRYWVGAWGVWQRHPWVGVGWENFGHAYLSSRLPTATEEIRDPHNFLVRFFAELGMVGGVLALAWLLRMAWEVTRPADDDIADAPPAGGLSGRAAAAGVAGAIGLGFLINVVAGVDFSADGSFIFLELFRRFLFLAAMLAGVGAVCLRPGPELELDDRPGPWVLAALLVGLGLFLVHNLIDFSLFEVGPLFLFALLVGGIIGLRLTAGDKAQRGSVPALVVAGAGVLVWIVAIIGVAAPVGMAEGVAEQGDELIRRGRLAEGAMVLEGAFRRLPSNADYAYRAAQAWRLMARADQDRGAADAAARDADHARQMFDAATTADPASPGYRAARAELELERPAPDPAAAAGHYEAAIRLDPNNVNYRLRYAGVLERQNRPAEAADAYDEALWYDNQLTREEHKRLPGEKVAQIRATIERLRAGK